jgi:hypothetical protein
LLTSGRDGDATVFSTIVQAMGSGGQTCRRILRELGGPTNLVFALRLLLPSALVISINVEPFSDRQRCL